MGVLTVAMGLALSELGLARAVTFVSPADRDAPRQTTGGASRNGNRFFGSMVAKGSAFDGEVGVLTLSAQLFGIPCNLSTLSPGEPNF